MNLQASPFVRMSTLAAFAALAAACAREGGPSLDDAAAAEPSADGAAVSEPSSDGAAVSEPRSAGQLELVPDRMYSGYESGHDYKLPVRVSGITGAKFSASDPGYVDIEDTPDGATLTMKRPGTVMILAEKDGKIGRAKLTISEYTPEQWVLGYLRYNTGSAGQAQLENADLDAGVFTVDPGAACISCHDEFDHPQAHIGGYSDAELADVFLRGTKPAGVPFGPHGISEEKWSKLHRWHMEPGEETGILAYLRAVPRFSRPLISDVPQPLPDPIPCPLDRPYACVRQEPSGVGVCVDAKSMQPIECETPEDCIAAGLTEFCVPTSPTVSLCGQVCDPD